MPDAAERARPPGGRPVAGEPLGGAYCSIGQAAALLGVSRVSIWRWIREGRLPASRVGPRTVRIKRADLSMVLARLPTGPQPTLPRESATAPSGLPGAT